MMQENKASRRQPEGRRRRAQTRTQDFHPEIPPSKKILQPVFERNQKPVRGGGWKFSLECLSLNVIYCSFWQARVRLSDLLGYHRPQKIYRPEKMFWAINFCKNYRPYTGKKCFG